MSLVSSRVSLIHRCTILRNEGHADEWGSLTMSWEDHLANVPCRAWVDAGREPVDVDRTAVFIDRRVIVPLGTDVIESDMVASVTFRGDELLDGPMGIEAVLAYSDHLELMLQRVR